MTVKPYRHIEDALLAVLGSILSSDAQGFFFPCVTSGYCQGLSYSSLFDVLTSPLLHVGLFSTLGGVQGLWTPWRFYRNGRGETFLTWSQI